MTTAVQHRRGTTAEHSTFTGLEGEVTIDTTKDTAVIHDGTLAGGYPLAKETLANVNPSTLSAITGAATASDDLFLMYDTSALAMKKISRAELNNAITIEALDTVDINGGTIDGTAIGGTTPAAGAFTTLSASGSVTLSGGTANGVPYLNGSKVLTSGSALTFDGSNLGLGVTPSAWYANRKAMQIGGGVSLAGISGASAGLELRNNAYLNASGSEIYLNSDYATLYASFSGQHRWYTAPSGTAGNAISFTQAMTLDASGNLLIGTSTPVSDQTRIHAVIPTIPINTFYEAARITDNTSADFKIRLSAGATTGVSNGVCVLNTAAYTMAFEVSNTERARIDSSGNLLVGTTSARAYNTNSTGAMTNQSGQWLSGTPQISGANIYLNNYNATGSATSIYFLYNGSIVGSVGMTGSTTSYNTSSDYRLKDNIQDITGSGAFIDALQPRTWNWKADGSVGAGFIAHELQAVSPSSVVGEKDAVDADGNPEYQAVEYGSAEVIAMLVAEVKSLRARLTAAGL